MNKPQEKSLKKKPFDLEERTLDFAGGIIRLCRRVNTTELSRPVMIQLLRLSGSVGANYREANEAISKRDFQHRIKITRKECKETSYWLQLLTETDGQLKDEITYYLNESKELRNIFSAIIDKTKY